MKATVRFAIVMGTPVVEVLPLPDNDLDRERVAKLADLMPLRFSVPFENVATVNVDTADITLQHVQALWKP